MHLQEQWKNDEAMNCCMGSCDKMSERTQRRNEWLKKSWWWQQSTDEFTRAMKEWVQSLADLLSVKGLSGMKKDAKAEKWKEILQSQKDAPIFIKWSANDEVNLSKLESKPITLADTALGRHQQIIKRQVNNVVTKMSWEEREDLRKKLETWMKRRRKSTHL